MSKPEPAISLKISASAKPLPTLRRGPSTKGTWRLYRGLFGSQVRVQSSDAFARAMDIRGRRLMTFWYFVPVFGKSVPDISLDAIADLGCAEALPRPLFPVIPGERSLGGDRAQGKFEPQDRHRLRADNRCKQDAVRHWNMCAGSCCANAMKPRPRRVITSRVWRKR